MYTAGRATVWQNFQSREAVSRASMRQLPRASRTADVNLHPSPNCNTAIDSSCYTLPQWLNIILTQLARWPATSRREQMSHTAQEARFRTQWHIHLDPLRRTLTASCRYPKHVWSPAGGWYSQPSNWRANTAVIGGVIAGIVFMTWTVSADREHRTKFPEPGRFYPSR